MENSEGITVIDNNSRLIVSFPVNLNEVIKMVHQMKSEMNMIVEEPQMDNSINFKEVFGELTPKLIRITQEGIGYQLIITNYYVTMGRFESTEHITMPWRVHINLTGPNTIQCEIESDNNCVSDLKKFIPYLKNKNID